MNLAEWYRWLGFVKVMGAGMHVMRLKRQRYAGKAERKSGQLDNPAPAAYSQKVKVESPPRRGRAGEPTTWGEDFSRSRGRHSFSPNPSANLVDH